MADRKRKGREKPAMIRAQIVDEHGKPMGMKTINIDDVNITAKKRSVLTPEQVTRAQALWEQIGRTARSDLDRDGWVAVFTRERDPDGELQIWEAIATTFNELWNDSKFSKRLLKTSLLKAIINVTMNMVDIPSQCHGITDDDVSVIRERLSDAMASDTPDDET